MRRDPQLTHPNLRSLARRLAFSVLRMRVPVHVFDEEHKASGRLRLAHVGDQFRGRYFVRHLYGHYPHADTVGHSFVGPTPQRSSADGPDCDLRLIEINRLYVDRYREAGYFTIPEWVEFGRPVVADERERYARAGKSLRRVLRRVREASWEIRLSNEMSDFRFFYHRMYLPYLRARFGEETIAKRPSQLVQDFRSGFQLFLCRAGEPQAGGVVRVSGEKVTLSTIAMLPDADELVRSNFSAAIDYHLHEWAAREGMQHINVGHTRPFPNDGVFFNKKKWQMEIEPDRDGVMNIALRWEGPERAMIDVLESYPFVYQGRTGLGVLCAHVSDHRITPAEARSLRRLYWVDGLSSMIIVCPGGAEEGVEDEIEESCRDVHFCRTMEDAVRMYKWRS